MCLGYKKYSGKKGPSLPKKQQSRYDIARNYVINIGYLQLLRG
jgi:hypothetical protein